MITERCEQMTKKLIIEPWSGKSVDEVACALKKGTCRVDKFLAVCELCEDGHERNIGAVMCETQDDNATPVPDITISVKTTVDNESYNLALGRIAELRASVDGGGIKTMDALHENPVRHRKHIATFETRIETNDNGVLIIHVPIDVANELREHVGKKLSTVMFSYECVP